MLVGHIEIRSLEMGQLASSLEQAEVGVKDVAIVLEELAVSAADPYVASMLHEWHSTFRGARERKQPD